MAVAQAEVAHLLLLERYLTTRNGRLTAAPLVGCAPTSELVAQAGQPRLDWLSEHGIEVIRLSQLLDFLDGELLLPRHAVVITIDDGELNGYSVAYQVLKERGLPFSLGIATRAIQEYRRRGALSWGRHHLATLVSSRQA